MKSCETLSAKRPTGFDGFRFINTIHSRVEYNWSLFPKGKTKPSPENWRLKANPRVAPENLSPEVILERTIAGLGLEGWANHVPSASGLMGNPWADKQRAIDLVGHRDGEAYDFIELKVVRKKTSDTPLHAAIEILIHGALYVFSRLYIEELGYDRREEEGKELLQATKVNLCVLAPDLLQPVVG